MWLSPFFFCLHDTAWPRVKTLGIFLLIQTLTLRPWALHCWQRPCVKAVSPRLFTPQLSLFFFILTCCFYSWSNILYQTCLMQNASCTTIRAPFYLLMVLVVFLLLEYLSVPCLLFYLCWVLPAFHPSSGQLCLSPFYLCSVWSVLYSSCPPVYLPLFSSNPFHLCTFLLHGGPKGNLGLSG
jgi:hypothetical protein